MLAAAVSLSACGDDGGTAGGSIDGAKSGNEAETPSPSSSPAPKFVYPGNFKVVVDANATGDKAKDAVLRDHGFALQAMMEGYAQAKVTTNFERYWTGVAYSGYAKDFRMFKKLDRGMGGTNRFYKRKVAHLKGAKARVVFCEDQSKGYATDRNTGKRVKAGSDDPSDWVRLYSVWLAKQGSRWVVTQSTWVKGGTSC